MPSTMAPLAISAAEQPKISVSGIPSLPWISGLSQLTWYAPIPKEALGAICASLRLLVYEKSA